MQPHLIAANKFGTAVSFEDTAVAFAMKTDAQLYQSYLLFKSINQPWLVQMGTGLVKWGLKAGLPIKGLLKTTLFRQFCGGESIQDCEPIIRQMAKLGVGAILDYSVEGEKTEAGFEKTCQEIIATIHYAAQHRREIPFCVFKVTGLAPFALLEKVSASMKGDSSPLQPSDLKTFDRVRTRIDHICRIAAENDVRILIDGEETWIQDAIDSLAYEMMEKYNRIRAVVYNTYQMYTTGCIEKLRQARMLAAKQGFYLGVKLVRGAYMEKERARAAKMGYPDPIQPTKEACDRDFDEALQFCIENKPIIALCAGTHNEASCYLLTALMEKHNIPPNDPSVYFAQLYGMSDNISFNLAKFGYNVAKYLPYGPIEAVIPYLFRRAQENTSVAGQSSRELLLVQRELQRRQAFKGKEGLDIPA
ncbi:MAG: proline dehydrogenase family protein [Cytophagales bacterium]|nr:proline dehydrogenase family protein [Bernardetiaceae bacterium]MDW8204396.1 proline dehydrogenase family protein [Cytophagales bacterium]